jgi:hypothetical protein
LDISATRAYEPSGEMLTPEGFRNFELVPTPFVAPYNKARSPTNVVTEEFTELAMTECFGEQQRRAREEKINTFIFHKKNKNY